MKQAYLVHEGRIDRHILEGLLPEPVVAATEFVAGGGVESSLSLASTLLARRGRPVALVADADTHNEISAAEQEDFLRYMLGQASGGVPYGVFVAIPEIEALFACDSDLVSEIYGRKVNETEWELAKARPKRFFAPIVAERPWAKILAELSEESARLVHEHPLVVALHDFLSSAVHTVR